MDKTILFHCAKPILEDGEVVVKKNGKVAKEAPTHTLAFSKLNKNILIMGWSSVNTSDNDRYEKKEGRRIAEERIENVENVIAEDDSVNVIAELSMTELPHIVIKEGFDYYLTVAINALFTDDEKEDGIALMFETRTGTVCGMDIDFTDEEDEELVNAKNDANVASDYIFATFVNDADEVMAYIQERALFEKDGYSDGVPEGMGDVIVPIMNDGDFVLAVDEETSIICHESLSEVEVIRYLKDAGLGYSVELEEAVIG